MIRAILVFLLLLPSLGHAGMYSWTDENGVKHFSNNPPQKSTASVVRTQEYINQDNETSEPSKKNNVSQKSPAKNKSKTDRKQKEQKSRKVIIYTTTTCGYCHSAKDFFRKHGVKYTEYDIKASKGALNKFRNLNGRGVPLIFVGDKRIAGFNKSAIKRTLGIP